MNMRGAIIGLGRMGVTHHAILNTYPGVKIIAVCDTSSLFLKQFQRIVEIKAYDDYDEMMRKEALEFVVVATPPTSHSDIIQRAAQKGIHVFAEKPLTLTLEESERCVSVVHDAHVINQVSYVNRFNAVFAEVKRQLMSAVLGDVLHFTCAIHAPTVLRPPSGGWRKSKNSGGGCLFELGSHGIDLVNYFFGVPDRVCGSRLSKVFSTEAEDAVFSTFVYRDGRVGNLSVNWSDSSYRKPAYRIEVEASNGRLVADQHAYRLFLRKEAPASGLKDGWNVRYATDIETPVRFYLRGNEFTRQLDYFVEGLIARDGRDVNSFRSALDTDRIVAAIRADAQTNGAK